MKLAGMSAYLAREMGGIPGKKAFQKLFYFLTVAGVPTGLKYEIYHYGPYSAELDYAMDNLENLGAIQVIEEKRGFHIGPGGAADQLLSDNSEFLARYERQFSMVIHRLPHSPSELELLSTTHFMADVLLNVYGDQSEDSIIREVTKVKGSKFSVQSIKDAVQALRDLELAGP